MMSICDPPCALCKDTGFVPDSAPCSSAPSLEPCECQKNPRSRFSFKEWTKNVSLNEPDFDISVGHPSLPLINKPYQEN